MNRTFSIALAALLTAGAIPLLLMLGLMGWYAKSQNEHGEYVALSRLNAQVARQVQLGYAGIIKELKSLPENPVLVETFYKQDERVAEIKRLGAVHDLFTDICLLDEDGYIVASTSSTTVAQENTSWFNRARSGQLTVSRPYLASNDDRLEFSVYLPVTSSPHRNVSVIKATLPFSNIAGLLQYANPDAEGTLILADSYGNQLTGTEATTALQRLSPKLPLNVHQWGKFQSQTGNKYHFVSTPCMAPGMLPTEAMTLYWMIPSEIFVAAHSQALTYVGIAGLVSILPLGVMAWMFACSFTRPLIQTSRIADQMAAGAYSQTIPVEGTKEMKQLARALNDLVGNLRSRASDLKLANDKLIHASKMKDEFLGVISHELRTPLNVILGLSEGLEKGVYGPLTSAQTQTISTIRDSGDKLLAQINDTLNIAKIEAGEFELDRSVISVRELIRVTMIHAQQEASRKGLVLTHSLDPRLEEIEVDNDCFYRLLDHLVSNAVKFTSNGGSVRLEARLLDESHEAEFRVIDSGIGISEENLAQLFQRFVQLDSRQERCYSGTGLGLYYVKHVAELHGGTVEVKSRPGAGSTFIVRIPHTLIGANLPDEPSHPQRQLTLTPSPALPASTEAAEVDSNAQEVLLVSNNNLSIISLQQFLEMHGHQFSVARNKEEVFQKIDAVAPSVILLDLDVVGGSPELFVSQIRQHPQESPAVILALCPAKVDPDTLGNCHFESVLAKPVRLAALESALHSYSPVRPKRKPAPNPSSKLTSLPA